MSVADEVPRDLTGLTVHSTGNLSATGDPWQPLVMTDPTGAAVEPVAAYFRDLLARGCAATTVRSYGMDLLRWFRFLWSIEVSWNTATRVEARDYSTWMILGGRPIRSHWRSTESVSNTVPLKHEPYSAAVRAHSETVVRCFYEFHLDTGDGPILNPFPLTRSARRQRGNAHHNPMDRVRNERTGLYRPKVPTRIPRSIPDDEFNDIFAALPSHRDRALVAFYVSTGARASELLSVTVGGVDPGQQLITVTRKGTRAQQQLPASGDAFVWLRLYQLEMQRLIPKGRRQPLWWTSRTPLRPLTYHAVHRMFERAGERSGSVATLHALRHTAAYRMAEDPHLPLTDVQYVLGHSQLTSTQIYLTPRTEDVVRRVLQHHAEQTRRATERAPAPTAPGYKPESLDTLFGRTT